MVREEMEDHIEDEAFELMDENNESAACRGGEPHG